MTTVSSRINIKSAAQRRRFAKGATKSAQRSYEETSNPIHAWAAIAESLVAHEPLPEWTRIYLLECAGKICSLHAEAIPQRDQIAPAVAKALGLQGRARYNPFLDLLRPGHDILLAMNVYHEQGVQVAALRPGQAFKWPQAYEAVAARHSATTPRCVVCPRGKISAAHVRRIWYARGLDVIPPRLVSAARARGAQTLDEILS